MVWNPKNQRKISLEDDLEDEGYDRTDENAGEHQIAEVRLLCHEERTCLEAMNREAGDEHRGDTVTWDTKGHHRNHRTTEGCVIRYLGGPDTVIGALTELLRMLAGLLRLTVSYHVRDTGAHARQEADPETNEEGTKDGRNMRHDILHIDTEAVKIRLLHLRKLALSLRIVDDDTAECEHTEHLADGGETGIQEVITEGIT